MRGVTVKAATDDIEVHNQSHLWKVNLFSLNQFLCCCLFWSFGIQVSAFLTVFVWITKCSFDWNVTRIKSPAFVCVCLVLIQSGDNFTEKTTKTFYSLWSTSFSPPTDSLLSMTSSVLYESACSFFLFLSSFSQVCPLFPVCTCNSVAVWSPCGPPVLVKDWFWTALIWAGLNQAATAMFDLIVGANAEVRCGS